MPGRCRHTVGEHSIGSREPGRIHPHHLRAAVHSFWHDIHPGDTLLGGQILALGIDGTGSVNSCKVVATSGDMTPDYGCNEASKEQFEASKAAGSDAQVSFMTIMVYGHNEHVA